MSKKLPLYAVDKCRMMILVSVEVKVKLEKLSKETDVSVSVLVGATACDLVKDHEFVAEDLVRLNEIITENMRMRDQFKMRRGRGVGGLAKLAYQHGLDGSESIAWTDDEGKYYRVTIERSGEIGSAMTNGDYGVETLARYPDEYAALSAALRAKLEGESAAVLEAVRQTAAAIYREHLPEAGTRHSFGMGRHYRNRAETRQHVDWLSMQSRKAEASLGRKRRSTGASAKWATGFAGSCAGRRTT